MKVQEFKKILKPLIEKTVKEVLLQEGVLSKVITEVVRGMNTPMTEVAKAPPSRKLEDEKARIRAEEKYEKQKQERIKRLNETMSFKEKVDIFEGTTPIASEGSEHSPLAGIAPGNKGVDISGIEALVGRKWKNLI
jgi:adenine deaminase